MPNTIAKNLHLCFTKIKRPPSSNSSPSPTKEDHSLCLTNSAHNTISNLMMIKNFNSLYTDQAFESTSNSKSLSLFSDDLSSGGSGQDSDAVSTTPDFSTVFASQRFFFSSPGHSNSIIESSSNSPSPENPPESGEVLTGGGIAIPTFSPDPYGDFRRSMQEMVESRDLGDVRENWEYLHELLLCYLALNPKSTHKFIVGAFADLLVSMVTSKSAAGGDRRSDFPDDSCGFSRGCL